MVRRVLLIVLLIVLPLTVVLAQDEEPDPNATEEAVPVEPVATEAPVETDTASDVILPLLTEARADLELLAVTALRSTVRPEGWNGSMDLSDPQLVLLIRLDLELLAGTTLGASVRPVGWFGAVASTPYYIARDVRHDLELLADELLGVDQRPDGWVGGDPLLRCNRATQVLVAMLERGGIFIPSADPLAPNYCTLVEIEVAQYSETFLMGTGGGAIFSQQVQASMPGAVTINNRFAVAFLDRNATLKVGTVPEGTVVTPVARSYAQFSKMTLFSGDDFMVFIDYTYTSLTEEQWEILPDADTSDAQAFCGADWCSAG